MDLRTAIAKMMEPLRQRVLLMIGRAVLRAVETDGPFQRVTVAALADETHDGVEHFQSYGDYGHPLPGAAALLLALGGNRSHLMAMIADTRFTPQGARAGERILYDHLGKFIYFRDDGTLEIRAPKIRIHGEHVKVIADKSYMRDVRGYALKLTHVGGATWQPETWVTGATLLPDPVHAVAPPEAQPPNLVPPRFGSQ